MSNAWKHPGRPVTEPRPAPWFSLTWAACAVVIAAMALHTVPKMLAEKSCIDLNPTSYSTECRK